MIIPERTRLGRYEIRSLLGAGGIGEVYLAYDRTLRRKVAIKILRADLTAHSHRLHRFEREAFAASALNHPNILTIYEIGHEDQHDFMVMEFVDGESLGQHIRRAPLTLHESWEIGIQIASALAAAHGAEIMHRDINPDNIMLRRDRLVKVLDFGLAKLSERASDGFDTQVLIEASHLSNSGMAMGMPHYMSPEQARGLNVDARTDIWSLGVVLYLMVSGQFPFGGKTLCDVMSAILTTDPPPLTNHVPEAPTEFERIVMKALRKDPDERYQLVKELGRDLKSLKERFEFEAELERSDKSEKTSKSRKAITNPERTPAENRTQFDAELTGGVASHRGTASSAEYVLMEIKRHKIGALLILATIVIGTAALAYFAYSHYM